MNEKIEKCDCNNGFVWDKEDNCFYNCPKCNMTESKIEEIKKPNFGDYVQIEQKRYGVTNEQYLYKVVNYSKSNTWVDVPVQSPEEEIIHPEIADVVSCICCGVQETQVSKFRISDVRLCPNHKIDSLEKELIHFKDRAEKEKEVARKLIDVHNHRESVLSDTKKENESLRKELEESNSKLESLNKIIQGKDLKNIDLELKLAECQADVELFCKKCKIQTDTCMDCLLNDDNFPTNELSKIKAGYEAIIKKKDDFINQIIKNEFIPKLIRDEIRTSISIQSPTEELDRVVKGEREKVLNEFRKEFIHKFCNDHNGEIRFLRSIFYDEKDGAEQILELIKQMRTI